MKNPNSEFTFEVSEKLFEGRCAINAKRLKVLNSAFIKFCQSSSKLQELFKEELLFLQKLDKKEEELEKNFKMLV